VLLARGRWSEAAEQLTTAAEDFARSRPAWAGGPVAVLADLRRRQGRREEASELLDGVGPGATAQLCRAWIALDEGDARRAGELAERLLRQTPEDRRLNRAPALELLVRSCVARGDLDGAAAALETLRELARSVGTPLLQAHADAAEGSLASAAADHERSRRLLEDAVDSFQRAGIPFEAAQARVDLATTMLALGRPEAAEREAAAALERLSALGADAEAARARSIVRVAVGVSEPQRPGTGLTRREREVLGLLAEGLTNRLIAKRLVVSEHTVHRHVTNILRKLDLPSRTAAAAHAVRAGLVEAGPQ
jgi:ATP/maltotriose-dependent transcriptional regulator MalT